MKFAGKLLDRFGKLTDWLADRFLHYFLLNPIAWFLLVFLIVAVHSNYKLQGHLDTVCDAIEIPDDYAFPDKPKTDLEKAQYVCAAREQGRDIDMPDD
jgi:hypothetical protein